MKKALALVALIALGAAAFAQNALKAKDFGFVASVGASSDSVGAIYYLTDNFALRPTIGFSTATTTPASSLLPTTTANSSVFGIEALADFQYGFSPNFAVYFDTGIEYTSDYLENVSTIGTFNIDTASLGVVAYLK